MLDDDKAGTNEGGIDIVEEEEAGRDTDGAAEIETGTGGRAVVVVVIDVEE